MREAEMCRLLGVSPGVKIDQLRSAYRSLVKRYHPDSGGGKGDAAHFVKIVQAYQGLMARLVRDSGNGSHAHVSAPRKPANPEQDIFALGRDLLMSPDPSARVAAAFGLARSGNPSSYAFLRKAMWDKSESVRLAVVRAVGKLGIAHSAPELGTLYAKASVAVRREILSAVGHMRGNHAFDGIVAAALRDSDPLVRARATELRRR